MLFSMYEDGTINEVELRNQVNRQINAGTKDTIELSQQATVFKLAANLKNVECCKTPYL